MTSKHLFSIKSPTMIRSVTQIIASTTARGAAAIVGGSMLAQLITVLITPYLARVYSDQAFGFLSLLLAVAAVFGPVAALKLDSALLLPQRQEDASALLVAAAISSFIVAAIVSGGLELCFHVGLFSAASDLDSFGLWSGVTVLLTSLFGLASVFALRDGRYGAVAWRAISQSAVTAVGQGTLHLILLCPLGLLFGHAMGRGAGIATLILTSRRSITGFSSKRAAVVVKSYWRFPLFFAPSALMNGVGLALPTFMIGACYSIDSAGQWGMADRILAAPVMLIGLAAAQVLEARFAAITRESERGLSRLFIKMSIVLATVGAMLIVFVWCILPIVLPWFLGPGWDEAASIVQIMVVATSARLVAGPASKVLVVLQRARANLSLDFFRIVVLLVAIVVIFLADLPLTGAAVLICVALSIVYVVTWIVCLRIVNGHDHSLLASA